MTTINTESLSATIPSKSYTLASIAALVIGSAAYAIGLFNAEMPLNEKGYYLIVLLFGFPHWFIGSPTKSGKQA